MNNKSIFVMIALFSPTIIQPMWPGYYDSRSTPPWQATAPSPYSEALCPSQMTASSGSHAHRWVNPNPTSSSSASRSNTNTPSKQVTTPRQQATARATNATPTEGPHTPAERAESLVRQLSGNNLASMDQSSQGALSSVAPQPVAGAIPNAPNAIYLPRLNQLMRLPAFDQDQTPAAEPTPLSPAQAARVIVLTKTGSASNLAAITEGWEVVSSDK